MQIMGASIYPIDRVIHLLLATSWWIYLVFLYCVLVGLSSLHPRVISYYRIFVVPLLIVIWSLHSTFLRYSLSFSHIFFSIIASLIGIYAGWRIYQYTPVEADKRKKLIKLPGTRSTLISILLIFFFRYYFGYYQIVDPSNLTDPFFIYSDLIISASIIGFILGKGLYYQHAYRKSPHRNLSK